MTRTRLGYEVLVKLNTTVVTKCLSGQYPGECATTFVVIGWGQALMPTAPAGPREDLLGGLLPREDQPPQEPPQFGDA